VTINEPVIDAERPAIDGPRRNHTDDQVYWNSGLRHPLATSLRAARVRL